MWKTADCKVKIIIWLFHKVGLRKNMAHSNRYHKAQILEMKFIKWHRVKNHCVMYSTLVTLKVCHVADIMTLINFGGSQLGIVTICRVLSRFMCPAQWYDPTSNHDAIGLFDRGQSVRHDDAGAAMHETLQSLLYRVRIRYQAHWWASSSNRIKWNRTSDGDARCARTAGKLVAIRSDALMLNFFSDVAWPTPIDWPLWGHFQSLNRLHGAAVDYILIENSGKTHPAKPTQTVCVGFSSLRSLPLILSIKTCPEVATNQKQVNRCCFCHCLSGQPMRLFHPNEYRDWIDPTPFSLILILHRHTIKLQSAFYWINFDSALIVPIRRDQTRTLSRRW